MKEEVREYIEIILAMDVLERPIMVIFTTGGEAYVGAPNSIDKELLVISEGVLLKSIPVEIIISVSPLTKSEILGMINGLGPSIVGERRRLFSLAKRVLQEVS